jgi:hypothetical protein
MKTIKVKIWNPAGVCTTETTLLAMDTIDIFYRESYNAEALLTILGKEKKKTLHRIYKIELTRGR